jgi:hypothetical protein
MHGRVRRKRLDYWYLGLNGWASTWPVGLFGSYRDSRNDVAIQLGVRVDIECWKRWPGLHVTAAGPNAKRWDSATDVGPARQAKNDGWTGFARIRVILKLD